jgi:hypothetical protein
MNRLHKGIDTKLEKKSARKYTISNVHTLPENAWIIHYNVRVFVLLKLVCCWKRLTYSSY